MPSAAPEQHSIIEKKGDARGWTESAFNTMDGMLHTYGVSNGRYPAVHVKGVAAFVRAWVGGLQLSFLAPNVCAFSTSVVSKVDLRAGLRSSAGFSGNVVQCLRRFAHPNPLVALSRGWELVLPFYWSGKPFHTWDR